MLSITSVRYRTEWRRSLSVKTIAASQEKNKCAGVQHGCNQDRYIDECYLGDAIGVVVTDHDKMADELDAAFRGKETHLSSVRQWLLELTNGEAKIIKPS